MTETTRGTCEVWQRVDTAAPVVALTVDDCDRPQAWAQILDVLAGHAVTATFFPLGVRVAEQPQLGARTVAEGHWVGSHGWDHARMTDLSFADARRRLLRDQKVWAGTGVDTLTDFRPPYGAYDAATLAAAHSAGYRRVVLWDVDPEDWTEPGASVVADRTLAGVRPGSVVVLHAVEQTADALPAILAGLRDRDLHPVSLPRLLRAAGDV